MNPVSIPKRVSEALNQSFRFDFSTQICPVNPVSIPKRVSEALNLDALLEAIAKMKWFQSLKGFQRL